MRLLLDACVWGGVREVLVRAGHDVVSAADWESDAGDAAIWRSLIANPEALAPARAPPATALNVLEEAGW